MTDAKLRELARATLNKLAVVTYCLDDNAAADIRALSPLPNHIEQERLEAQFIVIMDKDSPANGWFAQLDEGHLWRSVDYGKLSDMEALRDAASKLGSGK